MGATTEAGAQSGTASFEVEHFGWTAPDRLEVTGRWFGVRGLRFMRPTLDLRGNPDRRALALLDHKPWAAEDGEEWVAAFPWDGEQEEFTAAELAVAPSVVVELSPPGAANGTAGKKVSAVNPRGNGAKPVAENGNGRPKQGRARARRVVADATSTRTSDWGREARGERDAAVAAREAAVAERDAAIAECSTAETARKTAVAERDNAKAARDAAIAERDAAAAAREAAVAERDAAVAQRDTAVQQRAAALAARDKAVAERDAAVAARGSGVDELAKALAERNAAAGERDALAAARDAAIRERDHAISERDAVEKARAAMSSEFDAVLRERDAAKSAVVAAPAEARPTPVRRWAGTTATIDAGLLPRVAAVGVLVLIAAVLAGLIGGLL